MPRQGRLGLFHFAILVPDRATLGRFIRHIADRGVYAGSADHAVSEALYLTDPDGLGIEVYVDRPRPSWRVAGQELFMTTEPLDLRDLIHAAADQPWTGMPAGTTMGHIHLHVGDLDTAAAFYHAGLGLDKVVWSYPGALFLSAGGYHHHLGTNTWAAGAAPAGDDEARLLAWDLVLPDATSVAEAVRSLATAGHPAVVEGAAMRVRDPWGTAVRLLAQDDGTSRRQASRTRRRKCGRELSRTSHYSVVEDDAQRVPMAAVQPAHAVPHGDAEGTAAALGGPVMHGEDHAVTLTERHHVRPGLHARPLLGEHELAAGEVVARL